jgi:hypothetical protein
MGSCQNLHYSWSVPDVKLADRLGSALSTGSTVPASRAGRSDRGHVAVHLVTGLDATTEAPIAQCLMGRCRRAITNPSENQRQRKVHTSCHHPRFD